MVADGVRSACTRVEPSEKINKSFKMKRSNIKCVSMKMFMCFLVVMLFNSCATPTHEQVCCDYVSNETLVLHYYDKKDNGGKFYFLREYGDKCELIKYSYKVDIKTGKIYCDSRSSEQKMIEDKSIPRKWDTATSFRMDNKSKEKYWNYFSANFLNLSNDDKIEVLDKIISR